MNKRGLHHMLVRLQQVTLWQVLLLFIVLAALSIFFLRQNNEHMLQLRNLVKQADEQNKDIPAALSNLRNYITAHMNTSLEGGVYLEKSYQRAYDQAIRKAAQSGAANASVYQHADTDCRNNFDHATAFQAYLQCATDRITAEAGQEGITAMQVPPTNLYRYAFISPVWSPDTAGVSVLLTLLVGLLISSQLVLMMVLRWLLYRRAQVS